MQLRLLRRNWSGRPLGFDLGLAAAEEGILSSPLSGRSATRCSKGSGDGSARLLFWIQQRQSGTIGVVGLPTTMRPCGCAVVRGLVVPGSLWMPELAAGLRTVGAVRLSPVPSFGWKQMASVVAAEERTRVWA